MGSKTGLCHAGRPKIVASDPSPFETAAVGRLATSSGGFLRERGIAKPQIDGFYFRSVAFSIQSR